VIKNEERDKRTPLLDTISGFAEEIQVSEHFMRKRLEFEKLLR